MLREIAQKCEGLSGRALRKIPFLAHAFFIQSSSCSLEDYLLALNAAADKESHVRRELKNFEEN